MRKSRSARQAEAGAFGLGFFPALFLGAAGTKWNGVFLATFIVGTAVWIIWWHTGDAQMDR